ncbi:proteasome assembly chaperone 2 [Amborella trichopoda]|uniref:Proteasome assembly chaperone 2 n=1 Tax=Amborella trichopoda TaxID=13333 RepID=U5DB94_AMBTC|nr:proteasome assembly chaperone 2 [Amborella trichopoda]ERN17668.1 hypothetical protein AMTR_s00059p00192890 [Amborella trichopoda]|eukprot:XP_006856201.1 proteasome assembly chaperone 2 [Amborella trichopoda]
MEFVAEEGRQLNSSSSTLILPALSIGNIGQLAVDLLIASLNAKRVGFLDEPSVLPCVGNDAYGPMPEGDLAIPLEVYDAPSHGLSLIQQRSPVVKGMMIEFAKNLASCASDMGKTHIIILSGLDSGRRRRCDLSSNMQIHYISSASVDGTDEVCKHLGWKRLPEYSPTQKRWQYLVSLSEGNIVPDDFLSFDDELTDEDYYPSLPFAALFSCCKAKDLKVTCILSYCSEGDNIPDSFRMAEAACHLLGVRMNDIHANEPGGWLIPLSWKTVYGPPPDISLF